MGTLSRIARLSIAGVIVALLAGASPTVAQENPGPFPQLDGHRFSPNWIVSDPWVNSYGVSNVGVGKAFDVSTAPIVIDGDTIPGLAGDLLFAALQIEYQQKIVDWFAFRIQYRIDARLGTDVQSLLSRGINTIAGFEIGWLARLVNADRDMLSLDVSVSNKGYTAVDLARFVEQVVEGIEDPSLVAQSTALRVGAGLRWAHAFSDLFGIVANGDLGVAESASRAQGDEVFYRLGGQADFDFRNWLNIPLNLAAGIRLDSYPEAPTDEVGSLNTGFLRIGYVGRDDFTIGLTVSGSSVPLADDEDNLNYASVEFDLRYYF